MASSYRLDLSNRQGWKCPRFQIVAACWIVPDMGSGLNIEEIRTNLRRLMIKKGIKPTTLSLMVGKSKTLVKDLLEKTDDVRISTLVKLTSALDANLDELLSRPRVPIAGYIGAGGSIIFEDIGETMDPDQTVMRPPGINGDLIALLVRGDSMLPKYKDGDVIYIQRTHDGALPEYIGDDCAVRLKTGETYLKQLAHGSRAGLFTLRSLNAADIEDVEIEWATRVVLIMPGYIRAAMG